MEVEPSTWYSSRVTHPSSDPAHWCLISQPCLCSNHHCTWAHQRWDMQNTINLTTIAYNRYLIIKKRDVQGVLVPIFRRVYELTNGKTLIYIFLFTWQWSHEVEILQRPHYLCCCKLVAYSDCTNQNEKNWCLTLFQFWPHTQFAKWVPKAIHSRFITIKTKSAICRVSALLCIGSCLEKHFMLCVLIYFEPNRPGWNRTKSQSQVKDI